MTWLYTFTGPADVPTGDAERTEDEPGHFVIRERIEGEPGTCDLYVLAERNDTFRTAHYRWVQAGTPEECTKVLHAMAREWTDEQ